MPSLASFKIPTTEWKVLKSTVNDIAWVNIKIPDTMMQFLKLAEPGDLPPDYPNIDSHKAMFENLSRKAGNAVVSVDFVTIKGVEAFQTIFKFRGKKNS